MKYKTQKTKYKGKSNPNYGNHKLRGSNHFNFGKRGKETTGWKGGKPKCVDCGKQLSDYRHKRCQYHATIYQFATKGYPTWKRIKYNKIWMRSTWEVAYAKYLDKQGTKWLYESKTFTLKNTTYTPDFYLPESDTYVEIKGWRRNDFVDKIKEVKKLFKINIIILNKKELEQKEII